MSSKGQPCKQVLCKIAASCYAWYVNPPLHIPQSDSYISNVKHYFLVHSLLTLELYAAPFTINPTPQTSLSLLVMPGTHPASSVLGQTQHAAPFFQGRAQHSASFITHGRHQLSSSRPHCQCTIPFTINTTAHTALNSLVTSDIMFCFIYY